MKTVWMGISERTGGNRQGFVLRGSEILCRCLHCDAEFPQTDDGWRTLKQHGFEFHEQLVHFDWTELHGQEVTIAVVQRKDDPTILDPSGLQTELIARTKDGVVYFLPFSYYDRGDAGGFKCKPKSQESSLPQLMPGVVGLLSNG